MALDESIPQSRLNSDHQAVEGQVKSELSCRQQSGLKIKYGKKMEKQNNTFLGIDLQQQICQVLVVDARRRKALSHHTKFRKIPLLPWAFDKIEGTRFLIICFQQQNKIYYSTEQEYFSTVEIRVFLLWQNAEEKLRGARKF